MLCGQFDVKVDNKWRAVIPAIFAKRIGTDHCFIGLSDDNSIRIYPKSFCFSKEEYPFLFKVKIRKGNRIVIPMKYRNVTSFFFGKTTIFAGCGEFIELWPRKGEEERE